MSTVIAVVMVVLGLWTIWFAVSGVAFALRLLRPTEGSRTPLPVADLRRVGTMLLVGVAGVLAATSLLTAFVVTERPPNLSGVHATLSRWDATARQYESALVDDASAVRHLLFG